MIYLNLQSLYTFTAYYMVGNPRPRASYPESLAVILFGCMAIHYISDRQKEIFRATGGKCHIWGRPAKFIVSFSQLYMLDFEGNAFSTLVIKPACL